VRARRIPIWLPAGAAAAALVAVLVWLGPQPAAPPPQPAPRPSPPPARLAIVIDDVGYDMRPLRDILDIDAPVSLAVIPHQRHSRRAAELAHERGLEVLVHLPMEPVAYPRRDPGEGAVLSRMDAEEMRRTVNEALQAVPHARGLNNHMGSRLTASPEAMRILMRAIGERRLYFLDSRTAPDTVALEAARAARVPCLKRDVFLDARREPAYIASQLQLAAEHALRRGRAVAIGHPHPETLEVLRRELPRLRQMGVSLVFASDLAS